MLGTLDSSKKPDWKKHLPPLVYAYNCTRHESTKFSPFQLMFGRTPKLPTDSDFETAQDATTNKTTTEYVEQLQQRLQTSRELVNRFSNNSRQRQKKHYDKKAKASKIQVGDNVLVKILAFEGRHKIADRFEEELYVVTEQPNPEIPVFEVKNRDGACRTLHRNNLLLVESIDNGPNESNREENKKDQQTDVNVRPVPKPRKRTKATAAANNDRDEVKKKTSTGLENKEFSDSDESKEEYILRTYQSEDAHTSELDKMKGDETKIEDTVEVEYVDMDSDEKQDITETEEIDTGGHTDDTVEENGEINIHHDETEEKKITASGGQEECAKEELNTEAAGLEEQSKKTNEKTQRKPPPRRPDRSMPPPRRSDRSAKKLKWQEDYLMYQITRTTDDRSEALNQLLDSGILNSVSKDMANKLWEAVMK
ncbi:uncharacterized protein LOC128557552 [Mercenaria mercenaria]|uniref:uncharacterized protein LOC128557552 n=1 Tax=Mercenaria mercenaria TaxID=6596 RepID=UPI00234F3F88|nr:uncharacterized protein LOC128557552 [Mercenaria mercenaria]